MASGLMSDTINPATARFMSAALDDEFGYFENNDRFD